MDNQTFSYDGNTIAGFPEYIGNLVAEFNTNHIQLAYRGRLNGKMYVESNDVENLAIDPHFISSITGKLELGNFAQMGTLELGVNLFNIFNTKYAYFGYGGITRFRGAADEPWAEYIPAAERSIFTELTFRLQ